MSTSMLSDPKKAMAAIILVSSWQLSSYLMVIYIAGFTSVPKDLREAARIDGCSPLQCFRIVELPLVRSSVTVCIFLSIVRSFMVFDVNLSLTDGGPFGTTQLIAYHIYNLAFTSQKFATAQAEAVVLFAVVVIVSLVQAYVFQKREVQQ